MMMSRQMIMFVELLMMIVIMIMVMVLLIGDDKRHDSLIAAPSSRTIVTRCN